jgi:hypothetical protein
MSHTNNLNENLTNINININTNTNTNNNYTKKNFLNRFNEINNKKNIGEIYNGKLYITKQDMQKYILNSFLPIAITTTIFAPLDRLKTILQSIDLISIRKSEKVYKPKQLAISKKFL